MSEFCLRHPWMTFVLAALALGVAESVGLSLARALRERRR